MADVMLTFEGPEGAESVTEAHAEDWFAPRILERAGSLFTRVRYTEPTPDEAAGGATARSATYRYRGPAPVVEPRPTESRRPARKAAAEEPTEADL